MLKITYTFVKINGVEAGYFGCPAGFYYFICLKL